MWWRSRCALFWRVRSVPVVRLLVPVWVASSPPVAGIADRCPAVLVRAGVAAMGWAVFGPAVRKAGLLPGPEPGCLPEMWVTRGFLRF